MNLTESMKLIEDLVEDFAKIYEEANVDRKGSTMTCSRCGTVLHTLTMDKHFDWHKDISFRFFVIQSYIQKHTTAHVKAHADMTKILEGF